MESDGVTYFAICTQVYLCVVDCHSLLQWPLIGWTLNQKMGSLCPRIFPPLFFIIPGAFSRLIDANHGRHHCRHHDDPKHHFDLGMEEANCREIDEYPISVFLNLWMVITNCNDFNFLGTFLGYLPCQVMSLNAYLDLPGLVEQISSCKCICN